MPRQISGLFQDFQDYKSQKITTYSCIIQGLLIRLQQQKPTVDIKLPVPITDAKTMLNFSTLHKLHHN